MRKICLTVVGLFISFFAAFSQTSQTDSAVYKNRKLKVDEINLVASYYHQDGDHSPVTGGIGTQKLTNLASSFEIKMVKYDRRLRKHTFDFELGVDHYTSASSDNIDPKTISSASKSDTRYYPSLNWTVENEQKGTTFGAGVGYSKEFDYTSYNGNISFAKKTRDRNGEFTIKGQVYLDEVKLVKPIELRTGASGDHYNSLARNSYSGSLSYSQIINQRLQIMFLLDMIYQKGYLGLPFYRIYFNDNSEHIEHLPSTRFKLPIGFRANYFLGDKFIIRTFYRYYQDDWGLRAHTASIEVPVKITPFFSVTPFYRFYHQQAVDYFAPYLAHKTTEQYYTSNYDLSTFNSHFIGGGFRFAPPKGVFGSPHFNMLELRYGHYMKNIDFNANIVSVNLRFK